MKVVALIPARIGSTRFPKKMLAPIKGKSLISRTYSSVTNTGLFDQVIVATDSVEIQQEIETIGGTAVMSKQEHDTGTDRIAEVADGIDADVIINVQGDEPFIEKEALQKLIALFEGAEGENVQAGSLVNESTDHIAINNPNRVKVLLTPDNYAVYFSRSIVPYVRNRMLEQKFYLHIGIYAFRKEALKQFTSWQPQYLEQVEQLECNRFVEYRMPIKMAKTDYLGIAVDTPEDLVKAETFMDKNGLT